MKKWTRNGQLTVVWHVGNMKVSHKNKEEVNFFAEYMKVSYSENTPVVRGKNYTYVGMDLNYRS